MSAQETSSQTEPSQVLEMARRARAAADILRAAPTGAKNAALEAMAERLQSKMPEIAAANAADIAAAQERGLESPTLRRLGFGPEKIGSRVRALTEIAALPDPVGEEKSVHSENGLRATKRRVPIGVIGVIYEARPHVTINAGALCLKSGNAVLLKGGSEALNCNRLLGELWQESLEQAKLPATAVQVIATSDRDAVRQLLSLDHLVDLVIPRGGPGLIQAVTKQTQIPVIKHSHGICHVYVDAHADLDKARAIIFDSKTYAPAVCNAMETLLVHRAVADELLPPLAEDFKSVGVVLRGCGQTCALVPWAEPVSEEDWGVEYLDLILAVRIVESLEEAVLHIGRFGSGHTDAIASEDAESIRQFVEEVDSGVVLINASTMFNDASRLGMGAEIGISSDKIHARGPMGLRELTCEKWVIEGNGHVFRAAQERSDEV
ncbi:MAG: glutamate-5-semialdehyde dehydrogenase [Armatimonadetes bacterium]|nr:glutamate-5-semialdehyde dehydrogenase [Armatimonadota bacterium]NIM23459.1 glutamate-5-semialdehyde dehydrogenase [Armatimonadota bacterium]NIM67324.1 glutamate-5-semialdehyde dehydrogenase [Armatimonadota bacterium]NIM75822.1 glutamate-5-semialdehyde dehydrogenase [Armatimonadota bacterium]NIN05510.1 glutamate-5-semialdehyde dehydrogenase [Armatimonadota bacterium]